MKSKGFTLVELLAVIIILSIVVIVLITNITNLIDKNRENSYEMLIVEIEIASKEYVNKYKNILESLNKNNPEIIIYLNDLIADNYIGEPVVDPISGKNLSGSTTITVKLEEDGNITYTMGDFIYQ